MSDDVDYRNLEQIHLEALRTIEKAFAGVGFTAEEERFVEDAGRRLHEYGFELLVNWPQVAHMRPMVLMWAMAAFLGADWTMTAASRNCVRSSKSRGSQTLDKV